MDTMRESGATCGMTDAGGTYATGPPVVIEVGNALLRAGSGSAFPLLRGGILETVFHLPNSGEWGGGGILASDSLPTVVA